MPNVSTIHTPAAPDSKADMRRQATPTGTGRKVVAATFAGFAVLGAVAGCSAQTSTAATSSTAAPTSVPAGSAAAASTATGGVGGYKDGSYTADGSYSSPGGTESISVSVTLSSGVVTTVTVTPKATSGNAAHYQKQFASGISSEVVGKNIDSISVSRVSGSSLTSSGFNSALETIKSEAKA